VSAPTAQLIDEEVRRIVDECYATAEGILQDNIDKLHLMADALMLYETIDAGQIDEIMKGNMPSQPSDWGDTGTTHGDTSGGTTDEAPREESSPKPAGPIGGPAGEH
jgi:cell division protease FtsH